MEQREVINAGDLVLCDLCNVDGDAEHEDGTPAILGGVLVGSYALCNECAGKMGSTISESEVTSLDPEKSFGENVRKYRKDTYGTSDNITIIYS